MRNISVAKLAANRLNAQRSTGPTSVEGKKRAAQNARHHRLFEPLQLAVGESREDYRLEARRIYFELLPVGMREENLVESIIHYGWNLRRARIALAEIYSSYGFDENKGKAQGPGYATARDAVQGNSLTKCLNQIAQLEKLRQEAEVRFDRLRERPLPPQTSKPDLMDQPAAPSQRRPKPSPTAGGASPQGMESHLNASSFTGTPKGGQVSDPVVSLSISQL